MQPELLTGKSKESIKRKMLNCVRRLAARYFLVIARGSFSRGGVVFAGFASNLTLRGNYPDRKVDALADAPVRSLAVRKDKGET